MSSATLSPATALAVRAVTTRGVRVPLTFVLGTSATIVRAVPLLLVDVLMEEGVVGRAYVFCYSNSGAKAIAEHIVDAVELAKGHPAKPQAIFKMLSRRFTLLGVTGPVRRCCCNARLRLCHARRGSYRWSYRMDARSWNRRGIAH
jgi:hypothetical protein